MVMLYLWMFTVSGDIIYEKKIETTSMEECYQYKNTFSNFVHRKVYFRALCVKEKPPNVIKKSN